MNMPLASCSAWSTDASGTTAPPSEPPLCMRKQAEGGRARQAEKKHPPKFWPSCHLASLTNRINWKRGAKQKGGAKIFLHDPDPRTLWRLIGAVCRSGTKQMASRAKCIIHKIIHKSKKAYRNTLVPLPCNTCNIKIIKKATG